MGRAFYSADHLGYPFEHVREICFVFANNELHRQRSRLPKIILFLEGHGRVEAGPDFRHPIEPGDLLILPTPCYHHYQSQERRDARFYAFTMFFQLNAATRPVGRQRAGPERELQEIVRNLLSEKRRLSKAMTPAVSSLIAAFRQEQDEALPGWKVRLQGIAHALLVEWWRQISVQKRTVPPRLRKKTYVINEVKELLMKSRESHITLAQIAWHVQWSEEHLARAFKKETGMTVMDYLRAIRIDFARMQLLGSSQTVSSIASSLCFESISGFCRAFKAVVGQTPSQYRENHAGEGL